MTYDLIVIGASWGGLRAVSEVIGAFPDEIDVPIVIAQHRRDLGVGMASLLEARTRLRVEDVEDKQPIERGRIYLAPPDYHLLIQPGWFSLSTDERVNYARPSIDVLFESAAQAYGDRVVGVILTGANEDGAAGLARIKKLGGVAVIQDPTSAERHEMPGAALAAIEAADAVLPLEEIGPFLYGLVVEPVDASS
jgi:two-component system, chemotaxis family, protein-glutamate methylesterase/glutaminase